MVPPSLEVGLLTSHSGLAHSKQDFITCPKLPPALVIARAAGNEKLIFLVKSPVWKLAIVYTLHKKDKHSFVPPTCKCTAGTQTFHTAYWWFPSRQTIRIPYGAFKIDIFLLVGSLYI